MNPSRTLVRMQFGSHVYGTNVPTSDLDFKAVHVPSAEDILLQRVKPAISISTKQDDTQRNTAEDTDFESFALQKYMSMLLEGQTVALTMLFVPDRWITERTPDWDAIREQKDCWLHRGVSAFAGYCRQQASKYGIKGSRVAASRAVVSTLEHLIAKHGHLTKLRDVWGDIQTMVDAGIEHMSIITEIMPHAGGSVRMIEVCNRKAQEHITLKEAHRIYKHLFDEYGKRALQAEKNEGVDWKAMMHAVRVCREAEELLLHRTISYPRPEARLLLAIRKGDLSYKAVAEMLEQGLVRLEECQRLSTLPEKGDHAAAEELVLKAYRGQVTATSLI